MTDHNFVSTGVMKKLSYAPFCANAFIAVITLISECLPKKKNSFVAAVFFSLLSNYTYFSSERSAQKKDDRSVKQDLPKQCARRAKSSFHFKNA